MERAGGWYHVTARGNERRDIYQQRLQRSQCGEKEQLKKECEMSNVEM
jgi:hypothetical protein